MQPLIEKEIKEAKNIFMQNKCLKRCGSKTCADLRPHERQGVLRRPAVHPGKVASAQKGDRFYPDESENQRHLAIPQKAIIDRFTGRMEPREDTTKREEIQRHPMTDIPAILFVRDRVIQLRFGVNALPAGHWPIPVSLSKMRCICIK